MVDVIARPGTLINGVPVDYLPRRFVDVRGDGSEFQGQVAVTPTNLQTTLNRNLATNPLNTKVTVIASRPDLGIRQRALAYNYTGDKALTLTMQLGLGASVGLVEVLSLAIGVGNTTPQKGVVFGVEGAAALGTALESGAAPTLGLAGSWKVLNAPADHIAIEAAVAAGPTTTGSLQLDLFECS